MSNPLITLEKHGQSIWLDNISRDMINKNELKALIDTIHLRGITSNPTIFQKAIGKGTDYDDQIKNILIKNPSSSAYEIFEELAVKDIQDAADILYQVYEKTNGDDGFVSIEVSPELAYDTDGTIEEARRLAHKVNRPNVMIKIPATKEGIPAIRQMIGEGVNINITLIFSPDVYEDVVEAYTSGLEDRVKRNESIKQIRSVASFFISRIDSAVDKELEAKGNSDLKGKIAIANAKLVYQTGKKLFSSERFKKLEEKGAKSQRLLWASTSTKDPKYRDTLYVDELIGQNTVNTLPPETIDAFKDHGNVLPDKIEENIEGAEKQMEKLKEISIDFSKVTDQLTKEGVEKFADSFKDLLKTIDEKKERLLKEGSHAQHLTLDEEIKKKIANRLKKWKEEKVLERIWECDPTLWKEKKEEDVELSNRLGWLDLPSSMEAEAVGLKNFADEIRKDFDSVVLLGMGGSSLAPEVFFKTFGRKEGYPKLSVVDSTHPKYVQRILEENDLKKTLFIVSSKSGTTTETLSFFHFFYSEIEKITAKPGDHFVSITDNGSKLEKVSGEKKFRKVFNTPENVGGRYSALTFFGLVPAALIGVDIEELLKRGREITIKCSKDSSAENSPGCALGAILGEASLTGKDKLTILTSPKISSFGAWIEQLVAESTGKEGKGILPVVDESIGDPSSFGRDRIFVYLRLNNDDNNILDEGIGKLEDKGFPIVKIDLRDEYDLGKEFFRWEIATALAGVVLNINPFDQPNVQLAKTLANNSMKAYQENGKLPEEKPVFSSDDYELFGNVKIKNSENFLEEFLSNSKEGSYAAVMAFLPPNEKIDKAMDELRSNIRSKFKIAVTVGYGPRFLHSTGQLHKGDGNNGLFIQLTEDIKHDEDVPGAGYSFGTLITAQALGDMKALTNQDRKVLRIHFKRDAAEGIKNLL